MAIPQENMGRGSMISSPTGTTLPSELFAKYTNASSPEKQGPSQEDYEAILQNALSALAGQQDLLPSVWLHNNNKDEQDGKAQPTIPNWLWRTLTTEDAKTPNKDDPEYEWWMGTRFIHSLLSKITPFELHHVASQSIVFADGSQAHWTLCLLLCVHALQACPSSSSSSSLPLETKPKLARWKRWQSLVCETIRLFQNFQVVGNHSSVPLWIHHLVPACQHVIQQLPSKEEDAGAYHVALLSSLIGTTSTLVVRECKRQQHYEEDQEGDGFLQHVLQLLAAVRTILEPYGHSEMWVWRNPWRVQSSSSSLEEEHYCDEVEFLQHKNYIAWWMKSAHRHERVAGMDTSWDDLGISLLALMAFDNRPQVLTPAYTWSVWFPHVSILFKTIAGDSDYAFLDNLPLSLLDSLFHIVPDQSLPNVSSMSTKSDSPFETFQLLSNRIMVKKVQPDGKKKNGSKTKELEESKARTERVVKLMKSLLTRYQPINQVKIVRKLVHDCPHPGLQAKFMDLLRPVIFEKAASDALWSYISSFIKDLVAHVDETNDTLVHTDDLVQKVEVYVGAITMIQVWCMVEGKLPKKVRGHKLGRCYKTLKKMLGTWTTDELSMPPDDYYRLFLLEGALEQVLRILDSARHERNKNTSQLSIASTEESSMMSQEPPPGPSEPEEEKPIVGDVDIFS